MVNVSTKLFTININSKEYVFIDTYNFKNDTLYHFGSLDDELFCRNVNKRICIEYFNER